MPAWNPARDLFYPVPPRLHRHVRHGHVSVPLEGVRLRRLRKQAEWPGGIAFHPLAMLRSAKALNAFHKPSQALADPDRRISPRTPGLKTPAESCRSRPELEESRLLGQPPLQGSPAPSDKPGEDVRSGRAKPLPPKRRSVSAWTSWTGATRNRRSWWSGTRRSRTTRRGRSCRTRWPPGPPRPRSRD